MSKLTMDALELEVGIVTMEIMTQRLFESL